jgi:hypothetical protein
MDIIGHYQERATLKASGEKGSMPQSMLFMGPESVGKKLVALELAFNLVGLPDFIPTENQPTPLDVRVLTPLSVVRRGVTRKKSIGAEETREGLQFLRLSPQQGEYKVLIIDDAHLLTTASQNVLLKFAEEPEKGAVIIFITYERQKLLATLLSRLTETRFSFVSEEILRKDGISQKLEVDESLPEFFFRLGRPGILFQAKENPKQFQKKKDFLTKLFRLSTLSLKERLTLADELAKDVPVLIQLFEWFLPGIYARAKDITDPEQVKKHLLLLENLQETLTELRRPEVQARLTLERLFLSLS